MSTRTIPFASVLACLGAIVGMEAAALAQPAMPQAPVYAPPAQQPAPATTYPQPAATSPAPQQPAYTPPAPSHPPAQQQPASSYPPPAQQQPASSYPPQQQQGYPPQQQGYPPQQQGYPPQQQGYPPQQQGYPPQGSPAQAEPEQTETTFDDILSKLQLGIHLRTGSFTADRFAYDATFSDYGLFARYRFNQRWEAELAASVMSGSRQENQGTRELRPIEASALLHAFNLRGVDLYGRAGIGRSSEVYTNYNNPTPKVEYTNTHLHIGAGATYIFRQNIGVSAELRWASVRRSNDGALNASGVQYGLAGSYHF